MCATLQSNMGKMHGSWCKMSDKCLLSNPKSNELCLTTLLLVMYFADGYRKRKM